jgi:hypothetical protein
MMSPTSGQTVKKSSKALHRALLGLLLINFVEASGVTVLRDANTLDYVSLNYQSLHKGTGDEEGDIVWNLGKVSCQSLEPGCMCDGPNSIVCTCTDLDKVKTQSPNPNPFVNP